VEDTPIGSYAGLDRRIKLHGGVRLYLVHPSQQV